MRLTYSGLKSADRTLELGRLVLLQGMSGSGKSTLLDAISILACGYVPRLGKTTAATSKLMRNGEMTVTMTDAKGEMSRTFKRKGESVHTAVSASWMPRGNTTEVSKAIAGRFGGTEAPENIDLRLLLNATASERAARISALLDATGLETEEVILRMAGLTRLRLADVKPDKMPSDIKELVAAAAGAELLLTSFVRSRVGPLVKRVEDYIRSSGLTAGLMFANERKNEASKVEKDKLAARKVIEDRAIESEKSAASRSVEALKAERDAMVARKAAAEQDKATASTASAHRFNLERRIASLRAIESSKETVHVEAMKSLEEVPAFQSQLEAIVDPPEVPVPEMTPSSQEAIDLRNQADAIVDPDPVPAFERVQFVEPEDAKALKAEAATLEAEARTIDANMPPTLFANAEITAHQAAMSALELAQSNPWREVESIVRDVCRFLGRDGEDAPADEAMAGFARLLALAVQHGGNLDEYKANVTKAKEARDAALKATEDREEERQGLAERAAELREQATEKRAQADELIAIAGRDVEIENARRATEREEKGRAYAEALAKARAERQALRNRATKIEDEVFDVNREAKNAYVIACAYRVDVLRLNQEKRDRINAAISRIQGDARQAQTELDAARADFNAASAELVGLDVVTVDVDKCAATIAECDTALRDIDAEVKLAEEADARKREMATLLDEIEEAQAAHKVYTAIEWSLKRVRELDVKARAGGLMSRIERFMRAAGREETPFLHLEDGECQLGVLRGQQEIAAEALCGGEGQLFLAALGAAVVSMRKPDIRCLLIEAVECDDSLSEAMLRGLESVADDLDLVVVATNREVAASESWQTHRFEACAVAAQ